MPSHGFQTSENGKPLGPITSARWTYTPETASNALHGKLVDSHYMASKAANLYSTLCYMYFLSGSNRSSPSIVFSYLEGPEIRLGFTYRREYSHCKNDTSTHDQPC